MKGAYLDYAMSVITSRALPDVRDGLKPVQRRILYAMNELALHATTPYKKSARIVGEVLGKYHPHGDTSVYDTMVRLAQDFSMRYMLVDGQGNFGSVDGDPPAAMRYTEARLTALAEEMLADIDKDTVDFVSNFDDTLKEPSVLPGKLPNLLVNGASGIAVGMATNIPPHNLGEVSDAIVYIINCFHAALQVGMNADLLWRRALNLPIEDAEVAANLASLKGPLLAQVKEQAAKLAKRPTDEHRVQAFLQVLDEQSDIAPEQLMEFVKGPDFPTAGTILGREGIKSAYTTGHGRVVIRAKAHIEEARGGRSQIIVSELPFQVNKATLQEKIAEMVRDRRIEGISELRDESDRQGMRVVIELRRDASPKNILNQLFKHTTMQTAFSINMLALVDGAPRVITLKSALLHYINYRRQVLTRRTKFELDKARHRAHILEGLKIALDNLDEVIATIRRSRDADTARQALIKNFKMTEIQAQAVLDMQLRRLAALERKKILDELAATLKVIGYLEDLLAHPEKLLLLIRDDLTALREKYGDARRTRIQDEEATEFTEADLIPDQDVVVSVGAKGYVKRVPADNFRLVRRPGRPAYGCVLKEDDPLRALAEANTHNTTLFFTDRGRVFAAKTHELPDASRQPKGLPLSNFAGIEGQERVVSVAVQPKQADGRTCVLATKLGDVKRVALGELSSVRSSGLILIGPEAGDEVIGAQITDGNRELVLVTQQGQAIRFAEGEVRTSGRGSGGVRGIKLSGGDKVVSLLVAKDGPTGRPTFGPDLITISVKGYWKRMPLSEFSTQGRGGGGLRATTVGAKNGPLAAAVIAQSTDTVAVCTASGNLLLDFASSVPPQGRSALGEPLKIQTGQDTVQRLDPNDAVLSLAAARNPQTPEKEPTSAPSPTTGAPKVKAPKAAQPAASAPQAKTTAKKSAPAPAPKPAKPDAGNKATPASVAKGNVEDKPRPAIEAPPAKAAKGTGKPAASPKPSASTGSEKAVATPKGKAESPPKPAVEAPTKTGKAKAPVKAEQLRLLADARPPGKPRKKK